MLSILLCSLGLVGGPSSSGLQHHLVRDVKKLGILRGKYGYDGRGTPEIWTMSNLSWHHYAFFPTGVADERYIVNARRREDGPGFAAYISYSQKRGTRTFNIWHAKLDEVSAVSSKKPKGTLNLWLNSHGWKIAATSDKRIPLALGEVHSFAMYYTGAESLLARWAFLNPNGMWVDEQSAAFSNFFFGPPLPITNEERQEMARLNKPIT